MTTIDYVVVVAYFLAMAVIGFLCMRGVKHQEDYFLGGRRFGRIFQTFAAFGAGTGANDPVVIGRSTYTSGLSGIWSVLFWLLVTPFYWIFAVWYRRMRHLTLGDWFVERYESRALGAAYSVFGIVFYMMYLSVAFAAVGKVCEPLIDPAGTSTVELKNILVPVVAIFVILYGVLGGLRAAYWTDLIQGVFIILLSILLIPFGLELLADRFPMEGRTGMLGGFRVLHEQLPDRFFRLAGGEFPLYYVVCIFLVNLVGIVVQPHFIATGGGSAKSENAARVGLVLGNFLKRFCTVGWALTGLIMLALLSTNPDLGKDPDKVWGLAAVEILGPLQIGLVGLMVACLLAALMSSADCYMLVGSALVVRNIWAAYVDPDASEARCVLIGRVVGIVIVSGAAVLALSSYNVLDQLKTTWEIPVLFGAPFWVGMFWRRATSIAAWGTVIVSIVLFVVLPMLLPVVVPGLREDPSFLVATDRVTTTVEQIATPADVARRKAEIAAWREKRDALAVGETPKTAEPAALATGERFVETRTRGDRSVFWTEGIKAGDAAERELIATETLDDGGTRRTERWKDGADREGQGFFSLDFLLYRAVGVDLAKLPDPAIDALRLPPRLIFPFVVMIGLSLLTRRQRPEALDRFYVKMKTPTEPDPETDRRELELSYANPRRYDAKKLFPRSELEIQRPQPGDISGFVLSCLGVALVVWLAMAVGWVGA